MREGFRPWLPYIFQAVAILGAAYTYTTAQEHRMTVLEEQLKSTISMTQQNADSIRSIQETQAKLVALEEYIHRERNEYTPAKKGK